MSLYQDKALAEASKWNGWRTVEAEMADSMSRQYGSKRSKVEALTVNYPISLEG